MKQEGEHILHAFALFQHPIVCCIFPAAVEWRQINIFSRALIESGINLCQKDKDDKVKQLSLLYFLQKRHFSVEEQLLKHKVILSSSQVLWQHFAHSKHKRHVSH